MQAQLRELKRANDVLSNAQRKNERKQREAKVGFVVGHEAR